MTPIITKKQFDNCFHEASQKNRDIYFDPLLKALEQFEINTPNRVTAFFAQLAHESGSLRWTVENLNYSQEALRKVFGKYFPTDELAQDYHRKPEKIANRVYANRMGNGDEASGDGWRFRGRGLIQITGRNNYTALADDLDMNPWLLAEPEMLENPKIATLSAAWFWYKNNLNKYADEGRFKDLTRRINGGYHGLSDRLNHFERIKSILA